jgi:ABC-2 type transport system ATP-binding protein
VIEARELTRRFGDNVAADSVSFTIGPGEIVGLLGHNGAGKTTIMKLLTGFLEPSSGSAEIDGQDVTEHAAEVRRKVGYLPETVPLYSDMTVVDYLEFAATVRGVPPLERISAVRRAVEATGLHEHGLAVIDTLSRGFKQRVGVAQAILHAPRFLILDEPTSGLDPAQTQEMRDLIRRLAESATVILSTHIMQEVDAVCDRVMILRAGELALDEKLVDLQRSQRLYVATDASEQAVTEAVGEGVDVDAADGGWFLGFGRPLGNELSAEVATRLVRAELAFHALQPEKRDLETVFRHVSAPSASAVGRSSRGSDPQPSPADLTGGANDD